MFDFDTRRRTISRLVRTVDDDPTKWGQATVDALRGFYDRPFFFCPELAELKGRCKEIHVKLEKLGYFKEKGKKAQFPYEAFSRAASGEPTRLHWLLNIYEALNYIAVQTDEDVRKLTMQRVNGRLEKSPYILPNNSIVPSLYWANPRALSEAAKTLDLQPADMARQFSNGDPPQTDLFHRLITGEKQKRNNFDFRVTKYFVKRFDQKFEPLYAQKNRPYPTTNYFFRDDPSLGPNNGQNTRPLMKRYGNLFDADREPAASGAFDQAGVGA